MGEWISEVGPSFGFTVETTEHLYTARSPYQQIDIYQTAHCGKLMLLDGIIQFTEYDEFAYHEATDWDIVNYIRHNLTNYDDELTRLANRVGRQEGFKLISRKIYAEILKVYPEYRTTIEKQLQEHLSR